MGECFRKVIHPKPLSIAYFKRHGGLKIKLNVDIQEINKDEDQHFLLKDLQQQTYRCKKLIVATGGNPKEQAYEWSKKRDTVLLHLFHPCLRSQPYHNKVNGRFGAFGKNKPKLPNWKRKVPC